MTAPSFIDTNVLVYAASSRQNDRGKKRAAIDLMTAGDFAVSGQVLAEFYVTVTRSNSSAMPPALALAWIEEFEAQTCVPVDAAIVKRGAEISHRFHLSYWDGAIIAAAEAAGATTLYTEDLSHGQRYGSVTAVNPFNET